MTTPMSPRRRFDWVPIAVGLICGGLVALSIPPFGAWPLAWMGFAVLAYRVLGAELKTKVKLGLAMGVSQFAIGVWWVNEFSVPGYFGLVALSAVYTGLAVLLVPSGRRLSLAIGMPALFTLADWARDNFPLGGFPLGGTSLGQVGGPLVAVLRLGGSLLLTGTTVLAGVALAEVARTARPAPGWPGLRRAAGRPPGRSPGRGRRLEVMACAGLVAACAVLPALGWISPNGAGGHLPNLRVALVQGGGKRGTRAIFTNPQVVFDRHLATSAQLQPPLDLVVWPEGVLQSHVPFTSTEDAGVISGLAERLGATVLVGVEQDVGTKRYLNEAVAWGPDGRIAATYVKNHLVPFGEYVPDRSLLEKFFDLDDVPFDGIPGHGPGFIRTPAAPLGIMISYEVFYDARARGGVRSGGQVLVVPTDTASYRSTQVPTQELAAARLRAWETGRWLLQVTPTGYTAVVSPNGTVTERSPLDVTRVVEASVPRLTGRTLYVTFGDMPTLTASLLLAVGGWAWVRRRPGAPPDRGILRWADRRGGRG